MMYIERIADDQDTFSVMRQKNTPKGEWYGLCLLEGETDIADNDKYIYSLLTYGLREASKELQRSIKDTKIALKVINKARKQGWFDETRKSK